MHINYYSSTMNMNGIQKPRSIRILQLMIFPQKHHAYIIIIRDTVCARIDNIMNKYGQSFT